MQKTFADFIRINIFNEILFEGGFDPLEDTTGSSASDRCFLKFKEIDVDTQVKKENHIIQKYVNNLISLDEARLLLGLDPSINEEQTYAAMQTRMQMDVANNQAALTTKNNDGEKPATKGRVNLPSARKDAGNKSRPANQFGRSNSSNIKRSEDLSWLPAIEKLLENDYNSATQNAEKDHAQP